MKISMKKGFVFIIALILIVSSFDLIAADAAANANPTWYVDERVINHGEAKPYDYYGAKHPTIVY